MAKTSKNLGIVSAIHIGTTAPTNIYLLWYNISDGFHYYFDTITERWLKLKAEGGGGLAATLAIENITDGNDIKISTTSSDSIVFVNAAQTKSISLVANPSTGNFTQTFQDKSGTVALTSDITATLYNGNGTVGVGRVATLTDFIAFNGGEFRTENGYWQGTSKILYINPNGTTENLFIGEGAGNLTMTGNKNTSVGYQTLKNNTTGAGNIAIGYNSMVLNISGDQNMAIGSSSLSNNTTGVANVAIGTNSLLSNTTGSYNLAIGYVAMRINTTGSFNTTIGRGALETNSTGNENTVIGYAAMDNCGANVNKNTAIGNNALRYTTSNNNTAIGFNAALNNTSGTNSVAIGYRALESNVTGGQNIAIGSGAGFWETGSNKLFIDNTTRASEADGRAKALIYGIFDAVAANQRLNINASVGIGGGVANGTSVLNIANLPVSSVGLVTGDVWNNGGVLTIV